MTKHYGLFYTEPTESAITTLHFERIGELKELQKLAEIFVEQLQNINKDDLKFVWNDLTYCANDADYAYVILEVLDIDDKTIKTTYEENDRYYSNRDTGYWSEIMTITKQQKHLIEQKPKEIWICYYSDWYDERKFHGAYYELETGKKDVSERNGKHLEKTGEWKDYEAFSVCEYDGLKYELEKVEIK